MFRRALLFFFTLLFLITWIAGTRFVVNFSKLDFAREYMELLQHRNALTHGDAAETGETISAAAFQDAGIMSYLKSLVMPPGEPPYIREASNELAGKVIILDPGHGASTTNKYKGYDEQVAMLKLALKIKPLLESHGATVHLTREAHETVTLSERAAKINIWALEAVKESWQRGDAQNDGVEADIAEIDRLIGIMHSIAEDPDETGGIYMNAPFKPERSIHPDLAKAFELQGNPAIGSRFLLISLHSNATRSPINSSMNGATAFHISSSHRNTSKYYSGYSFSEQSRYFGNVLLDHIDAVGIRKRGVAIENYFMIREHNLPGVLLENGYHTNDRDRANLSDDGFLDRLALAYLDAAIAYFDGLPFPFAEPGPLYADVEYGAWYYDAVRHVTGQGLLVGTSLTEFSPDAGMTRAMLATVLSRLGDADVSAYTEAPYMDVPIGAWYGKAVAWAADKGIIGFIDGQDFHPGQYATREEIALMIYNYYILNGLTLHTATNMDFNDDDDISHWAKSAVYAIRELGVMQGDDLGRFNPQNDATRAEVSQIFYNIAMQGGIS